MATKKLKIGVIGAGRIGQIHAANVARNLNAELYAISDIFVNAAKKLAAQLGCPRAYEDYHDILTDKEVDAVLICSSTDTHAKITIEAAQAGKHIFCEKPIDYDLAKIDEALAAVGKAGVKLFVGFNRRFDPNYRRLKKAIDSGEIGKVTSVRIVSRDPAPPPAGYVSPGLFLDCSIHDFDMARFLMGAEVEEVYACGLVRENCGENPDTAHVVLKFTNGNFATIDNSRKAVYGYDQRCEVFGTAGAAETANLYPHTATISTATTVHRDLPMSFFLDRYAQSFIDEMDTFVDVILHDKPVPCGGIDGRIPVLTAFAAMKSYAENRPVKISEVDKPAKL